MKRNNKSCVEECESSDAKISPHLSVTPMYFLLTGCDEAVQIFIAAVDISKENFKALIK